MKRKKGVYNGWKTHCKHGHPYTPENTQLRKNKDGVPKFRECRTCLRIKHAQNYAKNRETLLDKRRKKVFTDAQRLISQRRWEKRQEEKNGRS